MWGNVSNIGRLDSRCGRVGRFCAVQIYDSLKMKQLSHRATSGGRVKIENELEAHIKGYKRGY